MFTNKSKLFVLSFSIIAIFAISALAVFAQDDTATPSNHPCPMMGGMGMGMMDGQGMGMMNGHMMDGQGMGMMNGHMMGEQTMGMMGGHNMMGNGDSSESPMFLAIADALGLSTDELLAELQAGMSIVEIATEKNIDIQAIYDAVLLAHQAHLDAAVEAGTISQAQADTFQTWMQENISNLPMFTATDMMATCSMGQSNGMGAHGRMGGRGMGQ